MPKQVLTQPFGTPLVDSRGAATTTFFTFLDDVSNFEPLSGTGSPEGVIEANIKTLYMDEDGTAGAILYIKRDVDDGAGDRRFGWILV